MQHHFTDLSHCHLLVRTALARGALCRRDWPAWESLMKQSGAQID
ncbi:hypothetical protein [Polaromonas sp. CG_9.11]|nr:hypothetical protein [Polaromonas sp. CG_9.11]MBG6077746.1 hypothetical protein [Polaromonas sp. CG_9.11]